MDIAIYQIDPRKDVNNLLFMGLNYVEEKTGSRIINKDIYRLAWYGRVIDCNSLEDVYMRFNADAPPSGSMRSVSVSDVVQVFDAHGGKCYFCDSIGFKEVQFVSLLEEATAAARAAK